MSFENDGKKQSDWWLPAVAGGIVGGSAPMLTRQISPVFYRWFGPDESAIRILTEGAAAGLVLGLFILAFARLVLGKNFGRPS
jgi:hypothetical protein